MLNNPQVRDQQVRDKEALVARLEEQKKEAEAQGSGLLQRLGRDGQQLALLTEMVHQLKVSVRMTSGPPTCGYPECGDPAWPVLLCCAGGAVLHGRGGVPHLPPLQVHLAGVQPHQLSVLSALTWVEGWTPSQACSPQSCQVR